MVPWEAPNRQVALAPRKPCAAGLARPGWTSVDDKGRCRPNRCIQRKVVVESPQCILVIAVKPVVAASGALSLTRRHEASSRRARGRVRRRPRGEGRVRFKANPEQVVATQSWLQLLLDGSVASLQVRVSLVGVDPASHDFIIHALHALQDWQTAGEWVRASGESCSGTIGCRCRGARA